MNNLKYDFIDVNHKRMHNALLRAGWRCENDVCPPGSGIKFNWVYSTTDEDIYFNKEKTLNHRNKYFYPLRFFNKNFSEVADIIEAELKEKQPKDFSHIKVGQWIKYVGTSIDPCTNGKWYQRTTPVFGFEHKLKLNLWYVANEGRALYSTSPLDWDLADIRDTNPDEETNITAINSIATGSYPPIDITNPDNFRLGQLKTDDQQECHLISKDNIVEVLEYNNIYTSTYSGVDYLILNKGEECELTVNINHPNLIQIIEAHYGRKLTPIPKYKFDFVKYLLDNGWTSNNHNSACLSSKRKTMMIVIKDYKFHHYDNSKQLYDCSEYNAKILVEMSNLGEKFQVSKELS